MRFQGVVFLRLRILTSGSCSHAVAPAELEAILFTDPEVSDAGVIGVYSVKDTSEVPL